MQAREDRAGKPLRLPPWLRVKTGKREQSEDTHRLVERHGLRTVCSAARCPNVGECYACGTATFLILGGHCTRDCRFCAVPNGPPDPVDAEEPRRVAQAVRELDLRYAVVTSVTRDDLPDGGAGHFAATIAAIREHAPETAVEVLTPDFLGDKAALSVVLEAGPVVLNHNVETVRRLQKRVRPQADYERSLGVLRAAGERAPGIARKSGLMVGLGESDEEIREALEDLYQAGVSLVTIGQYLRPTVRHLAVDRYVPPEQFERYIEWGRAIGLRFVAAGPFVRSSYQAAEALAASKLRAE
ncbi:MAG: lipoyl synthase [candidate division WS1 bacterium]|nr:lipoyl synthase [candidate division WS1 bacterium]